MKNLILILLAAVLICLLAAGCGGGSNKAPTGLVSLVVKIPTGLSQTRSVSQIRTVQLTVSANETILVQRELVYTPDTHTATASFYVLAGENRIFKVEALDSANSVIYDGQSGETTINAGSSPTDVEVNLSPTPYDVSTEIVIHDGDPGLDLQVPPRYSEQDLVGHLTGGVNPALVGIVVYVKVDGLGWWIKPTSENRVTYPDATGKFIVDITTGGSDNSSSQVAVYAIPRSVEPPDCRGGDLPAIPEAITWRIKNRYE